MAVMKMNVGILGLGIMGSAMAANLVRAGWRVTGYDPVAACRRRHARAGGIAASSAAEVVQSADILITSLPSAAALDAISKEVAGRKIVVETSTLPIPVKEKARETLAKAGATLLDCPLSGTGAQAKVKDLIVFVSGERAACRRIAPVLKGFSRGHYYLGRFGNGSKMKFAANLLVAIHNVSSAEAGGAMSRCAVSCEEACRPCGPDASTSLASSVTMTLTVNRASAPTARMPPSSS